ncbi:MAG: FKBP-type peptidyl-prolyl cis-trans isomerase [Desulfuromonadales bacterium]|nr:FKBP-type peptidyl-prolyl cis-trans isomerase [Desulfuromonadales bacterium]
MTFKQFSIVPVLTLLLGLAVGCTAGESKPAAAPTEAKLDTVKQRISYTIGVNIGRDFLSQEMDIDADLLAAGLKDIQQQKELRLSDEQMMTEVESYQKEMQARSEARYQAEAEGNLKAGEAFLAEHAAREGVQVTASGLQYRVIEPGEGARPKPTDMVTVHYRGTLIDGTQFDSSYDRGQPATFPVAGVIPGWTEALQLMQPGAKYELVIPSELAYGERGAGRDIGPNAILIFEVELLSIEAEGN